MERRRFARKQGSRRRVGSIASALPRKIACILLLATLFVHQAASQETPETTPEPEGTPAPAKKGAKCFEADYTYPMDVNVTDCRGKTFKIHRCADTQAEADLFARNLKIEGLSDDGCREFYDYYCTKTIIGGSTANPTAPCDYYCDQNFNPEVSDCDADTDCGGNTPPPFTPSPCCQGYELVCYNVSKNALNGIYPCSLFCSFSAHSFLTIVAACLGMSCLSSSLNPGSVLHPSSSLARCSGNAPPTNSSQVTARWVRATERRYSLIASHLRRQRRH